MVDVNDERPVFEQDPVIIQGLAENMPVNHVVHKFAATDKDSGLNGTVRYSIHSSSTDHGDVTTYFNINHETGELFISRNIDFEIVSTQFCLFYKHRFDLWICLHAELCTLSL